MRAMLGITIAVPVAVAFCLAYLFMLGLEVARDATASRRAPHGQSEQYTWRVPLLERAPPIFRES